MTIKTWVYLCSLQPFGFFGIYENTWLKNSKKIPNFVDIVKEAFKCPKVNTKALNAFLLMPTPQILDEV